MLSNLAPVSSFMKENETKLHSSQKRQSLEVLEDLSCLLYMFIGSFFISWLLNQHHKVAWALGIEFGVFDSCGYSVPV